MSEIDVSKCRFRDNFYGTCKATKDGDGECEIPCFDYKNCYYKQLQQLKLENEKLRKEMQDEVNACQKWYQLHTHEKFRAEKYKQCLDEIEEIVKNSLDACHACNSSYSCMNCDKGEILRKIKQAKEEE